jgi:hypothetical protein
MGESSAKSLDQNQGSDQLQEGLDHTREVLEKEYQVDTTDITNSESLTYVILDLTVNQLYDRAVRECRLYLDYKSGYPTYKDRTERLFEHIINTIFAIKTKKNLTVVSNLTVSKRKELSQAISFHFQDLKLSLQRVSQIEYQMRLKDSRSTIWVINTVILCTFVIVLFALFREGYESMQAPFDAVQQDLMKLIYKYLGI